MLYHSEILLGLIVILGSLHFAGIDSLYPTLTRIFPAQLAITFGLSLFTNYQVKKLTILVLVLLANAVFWFLCWILGSALPYLCCNSLRYNLSQQLRKIRMPIFGCFCLLLGLQSIFKLGSWLSRFALSSIGATYLLAVSSVAAISSQRKRGNTVVQLRQRRRQLAFVAALFLISPFLLAGKIIAVLSSSSVSDDGINGLESKFLPTKGFLILAAQLFLPVAIQFVWLDLSFTKSDHTETKITKQYQYALRGLESMRSISMLLAIVAFGPSAIHMGQGYHAGTLLATLSWLDLFLNPFGYENYGLQSKKATKSPRK